MRLRLFLGLLIAGAILPLAVFGVLVAVMLVDQAHRTFRASVQERVLATVTAIDATAEGTIGTLEALGAALEVESSDYRAFRTVAQRILATQPHWSNINLALPSGQQVVNLRRPQGAPLHSIAGIDSSIEIIHQTRGPVINDIAFGTATQEWDIAVRVPIVRGNEIRFILTGVVRPHAIAAVVGMQRFPEDWNAYVVDRKGRLIAHLRGSDLQGGVGQPAPKPVQEAVTAPSSRWRHFEDAEGGERYLMARHSERTGWTLALDLPQSASYIGARRAGWMLGAGLLCAAAAAFLLAYFVVRRRLLLPIERLAEATAAAGRGERAVEIPELRSVREIDELSSVLRDAVGAMREREELVRREKAALESADRAKNEFIAMLSHELRNPLAAITAAGEVLRLLGDGRPNLAHVQGVIQRQSWQMNHLVEDLLDMSRITMGKVELHPETFDLGAAVRRLVTTWGATGRFDRHRVSIQASSVWVHADRVRIEQVISNLLDNALKYTPEGREIRVEVALGQGEAVLHVVDRGEGLAPGLAGQVFDLFVQGERKLDRRKGGLGIGLALVRRLVEMHHGSVAAYSEGPGRGSIFTVRLPAVHPPARGAAAPSAERAVAPPRDILLVEDNEDARRMLAAALVESGHEVRQAKDGATALTLARERPPQAVLLDIGLPDMDGYEVARRLRAEKGTRDALLIAVTGYGQDRDRGLATEAGFDHHVVKPADVAALERLLSGARRTAHG